MKMFKRFAAALLAGVMVLGNAHRPAAVALVETARMRSRARC